MDPGPLGTLGVGMPFALAAQVSFPDKKVLIIYGDGSFGLNGFEFEAMSRQKINVVGVIGNDAAWQQIKRGQVQFYGADRSIACSLDFTRYDKVGEALGCHGEYVEKPEELRLAALFMEHLLAALRGAGYREELERQARTDWLTGLGNRRALERALREGLTPGEVLMVLDLDGLKALNDREGHLAGDALLRRFGACLQGLARAHGGRAFRLGGGRVRPDPAGEGLGRGPEGLAGLPREPGGGAGRGRTGPGPPGPGRSENVPGQAPQERLDRLAPPGPEERTPWRTLPVMENSCRAIKREPGTRRRPARGTACKPPSGRRRTSGAGQEPTPAA